MARGKAPSARGLNRHACRARSCACSHASPFPLQVTIPVAEGSAYQALEASPGAGVTLRIAVANGLGNAKKLIKGVSEGSAPYDFVEVMACPGGCIGGGGQPRSADKGILGKRQVGGG